MLSSRAALLPLLMALSGPASVLAQDSVFLEDLTRTEVRDALASGKTTVIIEMQIDAALGQIRALRESSRK